MPNNAFGIFNNALKIWWLDTATGKPMRFSTRKEAAGFLKHRNAQIRPIPANLR